MISSGHFQELGSVDSPTNIERLVFTSKDFKVMRLFLRLLSLWRPQSACFMERRVYPIIVNLILLSIGVIRNGIQATVKSTWLNIQLVYTVHEVGIWLGHILGNHYFASRDIETNVLHLERPITGIRNSLNRKLKYLNGAIISSFVFFSVMLCTLYIASLLSWEHGGQRFSSDVPYINGPLDHILYGLVIVSIIFDLGIGLALSWTLAFMYICFASRLKILENNYVKWRKPFVDAVDLFQQIYARPVKRSWKRISWWFLAHNIVSLAIPLYGYELAKALSGTAYYSKHLAQFVCYLVFVLTMWLTPIIMAEQIKRREKTFQERVNDISPSMLEELQDGSKHASAEGIPSQPTASQETAGSIQTTDHEGSLGCHGYTFALRDKELREFLRFLKRRTAGLVSRGYSLQLYLSLISLTLGAISFILRFNRENAVNSLNMSRPLNCSLLS